MQGGARSKGLMENSSKQEPASRLSGWKQKRREDGKDWRPRLDPFSQSPLCPDPQGPVRGYAPGVLQGSGPGWDASCNGGRMNKQHEGGYFRRSQDCKEKYSSSKKITRGANQQDQSAGIPVRRTNQMNSSVRPITC